MRIALNRFVRTRRRLARGVPFACVVFNIVAASLVPSLARGADNVAAAPDTMSLVWDAEVKVYDAQAGESAHLFTFSLTNTSAQEITIAAVSPGCSCTVLELPHLPWTLAPGEGGRIQARVEWGAHFGSFSKTIAVESSAGSETLTMTMNIPPPSGLVTLPIERARNLQVAMADRQAVFRDGCAKCHAAPSAGKRGQELYTVACGICHEAERRAKIVPDLRALPRAVDAAYWRQSIGYGKVASLMPAFAQTEGGPLTERQIDSLVAYLAATFHPATGDAPQGAVVK